MKLFQTTNLVSVVKVSDYQAALAWYGAWLGEPDEVPMEGMTEWQIADKAWLQLDSGEAKPCKASVVIGVEDLASCREALIQAGIEADAIQDWEIALSCDFCDPDGNTISLVQCLA